MSTKQMLRALTLLCGFTPEHIAEQASIPLKRVREGLYGWPLRPAQERALAALTKKTLQRAYVLSERRFQQSEGRSSDPSASALFAALDNAHRASFGMAPPDDGHNKEIKCGDGARRAAYVAWLLRLDPAAVFPLGPECGTEADHHLIDFVYAELNRLAEQAARSRDCSPRAMWFRQMLDHCTAVMSGDADPAHNDWFRNKVGYRRGIYMFQGVVG